jgi:hypothetical protein
MSELGTIPEKKIAVKRARISQTDIPKYGFKDCLSLAQKLNEELNGEASPHQLAIALDLSPTSSSWQYITGASVAYGLTIGAYNARTIKLSELGKRIVAPTEENDDIPAMVEAALKPKIISDFYEKYNRGKFPSDKIAENVLQSLGVPKERTMDVLSMIKEIGELTGILHNTKTGLYVSIDTPDPIINRDGDDVTPTDSDSNNMETDMETFAKKLTGNPRASDIVTKVMEKSNNRVFITHGKDHEIVGQLKELLTFGKFEPIVSIEKETLSISVPEKVMQDMRSCSAAVIHVVGEGEVLD